MYGPGGPTDSDFVQLATEHVDETYGAGRARGGEGEAGAEGAGQAGGRLGREERARLVDETARRLSDTYLRAVLTGQVRRVRLV